MSVADDSRAEVERRVAALFDSPDELYARFDRNDDGVLDAEEWTAARAVLEREATAALPRERLDDRFVLIAPLGEGAQGATFLAHDLQSGDFVAVKELDFRRASDWKAIERFDREAAVLADLQHPSIPAFIGTFEIQEDELLRKFIVQEFIGGRSLEAELRVGRLFDEDSVRAILRTLLDVLEYLHSRTPPVLHRDIKPGNIVRREDGSVVLVDFGGVEQGQSTDTVVGTSGYMPPEQLMGRASPASDLYAVGATAIHLLSREHPSQLIDEELEFEWHSVHTTPAMQIWLTRCVRAVAEDRFTSAAEARDALPDGTESALMARPETRITLSHNLDLVVPIAEHDEAEIHRAPGEILVSFGEPVIPPLAGAILGAAMFVGLFTFIVITVKSTTPIWAVAFVVIAPLAFFAYFWRRRRVLTLKGNHHGLLIEYLQGPRMIEKQIPFGKGGLESISLTMTSLKVRAGGEVFTLRQHGNINKPTSAWVEDQLLAFLREVHS